jgi:hypothetical protein
MEIAGNCRAAYPRFLFGFFLSHEDYLYSWLALGHFVACHRVVGGSGDAIRLAVHRALY